MDHFMCNHPVHLEKGLPCLLLCHIIYHSYYTLLAMSDSVTISLDMDVYPQVFNWHARYSADQLTYISWLLLTTPISCPFKWHQLWQEWFYCIRYCTIPVDSLIPYAPLYMIVYTGPLWLRRKCVNWLLFISTQIKLLHIFSCYTY